MPFCQHLELHILCVCHVLDFLHTAQLPCPLPSRTKTAQFQTDPHALTPSHHTRCPGWCSSLWPRTPAPGLLSSEKVPQGSVSPTPLDVSDFLLTCSKLSNRFKGFWDNIDRQPVKSHQCCFLSKHEGTFGKGCAGWPEPQGLMEKRREQCVWGMFFVLWSCC